MVSPRKSLATLVQLWSGKRCPHESVCACRTSEWCPKAKGELPDDDYQMIHLAGCSFGYDHCCCRVLDEIESLANQYLEQAGIHKPPVPMDIIQLFDTKHPVEIRPLPMRRYLGCTWFVDDEWVIHLNEDNRPDINNFTAFHEGFHIVSGISGLAFSKKDDYRKPLNERLADYFAASISMPRSFIFDMWPEVKNVEKMASIFKVPESVMIEWLVRLRILQNQPLVP